uniref:NF-kappa-B inhibitor-interacting Ras-like protein n=1 Tax=Setaria digitata TaxID=48799 RepID=A0A915PJB9_9BILA
MHSCSHLHLCTVYKDIELKRTGVLQVLLTTSEMMRVNILFNFPKIFRTFPCPERRDCNSHRLTSPSNEYLSLVAVDIIGYLSHFPGHCQSDALRKQESDESHSAYTAFTQVVPQMYTTVRNDEARLVVPSNGRRARGSSDSGKSCKCYCQGGKRISYPYGWTSAVQDSSDESSRTEDRSPATKSTHGERVSYQTAHPVAARHLENQTLERKPSVSTQVLSALIGNSGSNTYSRIMGKVMRVLVAGSKKVGKTACLEQLACLNDITNQPYVPTIEDTYQVQMDYGDRPKEIMVFHDTAGISASGPIELKRSYIQVADAFLLIYSVVDHETFNRMDMLKKTIDKQFGKDKKEVPIVVLGNMTDLPGRKVDSEFAQSWASKERVKLYEVTAKNRSTLVDLVIYLGSRHFHSQRESKFSLSKKLKAEKANAAIMMDL